MSKIVAGRWIESENRFETASHSHAVPAVRYQTRLNGYAIRVEREGKGGHVTLIRDGRTYLIVLPGARVIGRFGFSGQSDSYVLERFGELDYTVTDGFRRPSVSRFCETWDRAIGEIGLAFLF